MNESQQDAPDELDEPDDGKTYSADYVKKLRAEAAKYRNEAKDLRPAAERLAQLEEANKSELEKATARAEAAEKALNDATLANDRVSVALAKGLDPELAPLISGTTKSEIEANAELLASKVNAKAPQRPVTGTLKSGAASGDDAGMTGKGRAAAAVRRMRGSDH